MLSLKYIITEEVTCVDAAEIMKCFEKWGGGRRTESMAPCPQEIQGEKRVFLVFLGSKVEDPMLLV